MRKHEIYETLKNLEKHSDCDKRGVAAILVDGLGTIAKIGYNHKVLSALSDLECIKCEEQCDSFICPAIHAEIDCLNKISKDEIALRNLTTMYVSYSPCPECCKAILAAGIKTIFVKEPRLKPVPGAGMNYDELSEKLLEGVKYIRMWEHSFIDTVYNVGELR